VPNCTAGVSVSPPGCGAAAVCRGYTLAGSIRGFSQLGAITLGSNTSLSSSSSVAAAAATLLSASMASTSDCFDTLQSCLRINFCVCVNQDCYIMEMQSLEDNGVTTLTNKKWIRRSKFCQNQMLFVVITQTYQEVLLFTYVTPYCHLKFFHERNTCNKTYDFNPVVQQRRRLSCTFLHEKTKQCLNHGELTEKQPTSLSQP